MERPVVSIFFAYQATEEAYLPTERCHRPSLS
jgi:hypothetical protein